MCIDQNNESAMIVFYSTMIVFYMIVFLQFVCIADSASIRGRGRGSAARKRGASMQQQQARRHAQRAAAQRHAFEPGCPALRPILLPRNAPTPMIFLVLLSVLTTWPLAGASPANQLLRFEARPCISPPSLKLRVRQLKQR